MAIETALINKCKRELIKMTNLWIVTMGYEVCRLEQTLSCGPIKLIFDWLVGTFLAKGNNLNQMNITNDAKTKRALWPTLRSSLTVKKLLNFLKLKSNFMHQLIMKCPLWESKIYLLLSLYYYISSIRIKAPYNFNSFQSKLVMVWNSFFVFSNQHSMLKCYAMRSFSFELKYKSTKAWQQTWNL